MHKIYLNSIALTPRAWMELEPIRLGGNRYLVTFDSRDALKRYIQGNKLREFQSSENRVVTLKSSVGDIWGDYIPLEDLGTNDNDIRVTHFNPTPRSYYQRIGDGQN